MTAFDIDLASLNADTIRSQLDSLESLPTTDFPDVARAVTLDLLDLELSFQERRGVDELAAVRNSNGSRGDLYSVGLVPFGSPEQLWFTVERRAGAAIISEQPAIQQAIGKMGRSLMEQLRREHPDWSKKELTQEAWALIDAKIARDARLFQQDAWIDSTDYRFAVSFTNTAGSHCNRTEHSMIVATTQSQIVFDLEQQRILTYRDGQPTATAPTAFTVGLLRAAAHDLLSWASAVI